jgi:imidazolonepropionase
MTTARLSCDHLWKNARLATMVDGADPFADGMVAQRGGATLYAGPAATAPAFEPAASTDCGGRLVTPGLIDCHTHLVHAGNRTNEAEARLAGATYEDIARSGGGIMATVRATRAASEDELVALSLPRLDALLADGVTTVEIKSGYGLTLADELKMLRAARQLAVQRNVSIRTSFLGAHAVPPEFAGDADGYIAHICEVMIPAVAASGLADAVDAFCENIAFSPAQTDRIMAAARTHGLPVKLHAEQLSNQGGAAVAARHGALSADHLEHLGTAGIAAMAASGTVAVLLPGAFFHLRETLAPPVAALRAANVPVAIATDCNPGTSPLTSLLLAMNMAATLFRLTVPECLAGVTRNAARALGMADEIGTLEPGKRCDLAIWDVANPADLVCRMGPNALHARIFNGAIV